MLRTTTTLLVAALLAAGGCKKRPDFHRPVPPPAPLAPKNPVFFAADFERGKIGRFDFSWLHNRWAAKVVTKLARHGKGALEISLRRSDKMASKGKRAELLVPYAYRHGRGYWYGLSIYLPTSWKPDYEGDVLAQWFGPEDLHLGERGRSPVLALRIRNKKWFVNGRWDDRPVTQDNSGRKFLLYKTPYQRGRWTDWVVHARWSYKKDAPPAEQGLIEVYKDGTKVALRRGPNCYNDKHGPVLKLGVYKAPWNDPETKSAVSVRTAYFDDVRVGSEAAGYAGVAPGEKRSPSAPPATAATSRPTKR